MEDEGQMKIMSYCVAHIPTRTVSLW